MIQLQCECCGKHMKAPREAAGKQAKCPGCGHSVYIPTPQDEVDELPLAPEDAEEARREEALLEERRRLDRMIAREDRVPPENASSRPAANRESGGASSRMPPSGGASAAKTVQEAVTAYLTSMRDSNLDGAQRALDVLKRYSAEARPLVERLAADQLQPPQLARVPAPVYRGFLKSLLSQL